MCLCMGNGHLEHLCVMCLIQGVTHQQWYLFNDFLIEPIDKVSVLFINLMLLKCHICSHDILFLCVICKRLKLRSLM